MYTGSRRRGFKILGLRGSSILGFTVFGGCLQGLGFTVGSM